MDTIDLRKTSITLSGDRPISITLAKVGRGAAKELKELFTSLCVEWIRTGLQVGELMADDKSWEVIEKISEHFSADDEALPIDEMLPLEIEALFLTQNRIDPSEAKQLRAYQSVDAEGERWVSVELSLPNFLGGALMELAGYQGTMIMQKAHRVYFDGLQKAEEVTGEEEPQDKPVVKKGRSKKVNTEVEPVAA